METKSKEYLDTGYIVYADGKVFGRMGHFLSPKTDRYGYEAVTLFVDGKSIYKTVHRLVAEVFIPNPENKPTVNHKDGDKKNNNLPNLEWNTWKENKEHAVLNGLCAYGETNGKSIHTEEQIHEVCRLLSDGFRNVDIAKKTGIHRHEVACIRTNGLWKHISSQYEIPFIFHQGISMETFEWCCKKLQDKVSYQDILKAYTGGEYLTYACLKKIKARKMRPKYSEKYTF